MTVALYINGLGEVAFRPMFCARALPRSKKNKIVYTGEYVHIKPDNTSKIVKVHSERYRSFIVYRTKSGWNERAVLCKELELLNKEMLKQDRKIIFTMDHAPAHLIGDQPLTGYSNIRIEYIGRKMTSQLQEILQI